MSFKSYSDEGALQIDLDSYAVSETIPLGGAISRMAVVETSADTGVDLEGTDTADSLVGIGADEQLRGHGGDDTIQQATQQSTSKRPEHFQLNKQL